MTISHKSWAGRFTVKDSVRGEVEAVFATLGQTPDLDGDVYAPNAIRSADNIAVSSWNHSSSAIGGRLPVGVASVRTVGDEAVTSVRYFMDLASGREAFEVMKRLGSTEWSWSLDVVDAETITLADGRMAREIRDVRALEVSPVLRGAGVGTRTLSTRSASEAAAHELARFIWAGHERRTRAQLADIAEKVAR